MRIGPTVRHLFGPYEYVITSLYRRFFVDLGAFAKDISKLNPTTLLEVGCGEGLLTRQLCQAMPEAVFVGVDICDGVGRLFPSDVKERSSVEFHQFTIFDFIQSDSRKFDVIVVCDVLHHIPTDSRRDFLVAVGSMLTPGGVLIVKDWEKTFSFIHFLAYFSDRVITGDRISYLTVNTMKNLVTEAIPTLKVQDCRRIRPYDNNFYLTFVSIGRL